MLPDKKDGLEIVALRSSELIVNEISTKWSVYLSVFLACLSILLSLIFTTIWTVKHSLLYILFLIIFVVTLVPVDVGASSTIPLAYRFDYKTNEARIDLEKIKEHLRRLGFKSIKDPSGRGVAYFFDLSNEPYECPAFKLRIDVIPFDSQHPRVLLNVYVSDRFLKLLLLSIKQYRESVCNEIKGLSRKPGLVPRTVTSELREDIYLILSRVLTEFHGMNFTPEIAV